jgi:hypothetical protein
MINIEVQFANIDWKYETGREVAPIGKNNY